jgi:hypothetical protein
VNERHRPIVIRPGADCEQRDGESLAAYLEAMIEKARERRARETEGNSK